MPVISLLIRIIAVGKIKDFYLQHKIREYVDRINHDFRLEIIEIKDSSPQSEGLKILEILRKSQGYVFALSEQGKEYDSLSFAKKLANINSEIDFIIGGPDGISEEVKSVCREHLSLSRMTFTHEIARLLLLEQLYRTATILNNRKYHRK
jgi:23S rRNA (pseudouridine1915-N3)-methyltransferase